MNAICIYFLASLHNTDSKSGSRFNIFRCLHHLFSVFLFLSICPYYAVPSTTIRSRPHCPRDDVRLPFRPSSGLIKINHHSWEGQGSEMSFSQNRIRDSIKHSTLFNAIKDARDKGISHPADDNTLDNFSSVRPNDSYTYVPVQQTGTEPRHSGTSVHKCLWTTV